MPIFPIQKLKPISGKIEGVAHDVSVTIDFHPFILQIYERETPEEIDTELRLDGVNLPTLDLTMLQNQSFEFPVNPNEGYIDGSIYIEHAHHPVDVTHLKFGTKNGSLIDIEIILELIFEYEGLGQFENTPWICSTKLQST